MIKQSSRIFVRNGRRTYRRQLSVNERRFGIGILIMLVFTITWIAWKGRHADPTLVMLEANLAQEGVAAGADRGPLPTLLTGPGWFEGKLSQFDADNLHEKTDGREGYFKSFGFERLYFLSIVSAEDERTAIDIELYDLGNSANALGAYSGECSPGVTTTASESGLSHFDGNALYFTQGRYYLRAIGSEESPLVRTELEHVRDRFESELPSEPLPWGYALFAGRMGADPGSIAFEPDNAFSFGFARNVYSMALEDSAELFVTPAGTEAGARAMATRFMSGFGQYGTVDGDYIKDRNLGTYAMATASGPWVVGIHRAKNKNTAQRSVTELAEILKDWPLPGVPTATVEPPTGDDEEAYGTDEH